MSRRLERHVEHAAVGLELAQPISAGLHVCRLGGAHRARDDERLVEEIRHGDPRRAGHLRDGGEEHADRAGADDRNLTSRDEPACDAA